MARFRTPLLASTALLTTLAVPVLFAEAPDRTELMLKDIFEGRHVTVRIDMPGTHEGVNVYPESRRGLDFDDYRTHLRRYGVAIRAGETAMVTLVKVKNDLIEFQLGGGGYGTFFDNTDTSADIPFVGRSDRERDLERLISRETDRYRRRQLERELDGLREWRDRENRRIAYERERVSQRKADRLAFRRLNGGSRFNIRFRDRVPHGFGPDDLVAALDEYVDFDGRRGRYGR